MKHSRSRRVRHAALASALLYAYGTAAFAHGPGLLSVSHGPKEFVKRGDVEDCALVYALAAARLLS